VPCKGLRNDIFKCNRTLIRYAGLQILQFNGRLSFDAVSIVVNKMDIDRNSKF
jgi:hypothetical protein